MKKKISQRGQRNRVIALLIVLLLTLLIIVQGYHHLRAKNIPEKITETSKNTPDSPLTTEVLQLDVPLLNQMDAPPLFNGCEVTSLAMLLNYAGNPVTKNQLADAIPTLPLYDAEGNYGDPYEGFVGDIYGNTVGYSVYHTAIADLALNYLADGQSLIDLTDQDFENLLQQLLEGNPVWVITTVPMTATADLEEWQTLNGPVTISWNVHSVVMTGFDTEFIYVNDPYGEKDKQVNRQDFEEAWLQMGSQAITIAL